MKFSNGRVQVYCDKCRAALIKLKSPWQPRASSLHNEVIAYEMEIVRTLNSRKPRQKMPFKIIDDVAFLYFCADLPKSAEACKRELSGREIRSREASELTHPLRDSWPFNGAHLNPLGTVDAFYRRTLLEAAIAVFKGIKNIQYIGLKRHFCEASLAGLFEALEDAGREELVARANGWPKYLRERVRKIIDKPRTMNQYARHTFRRGWSVSEARLAVNHGQMPKYARF